MLVIVAYKIAVASFVGPSQAATILRMALSQHALDRIAGYDRVIYQQAERDNQGRYRYLLNIDSEHVHHAEGHGQGDGDGNRHQYGRAPLPKADQRDQHNQNDRLIQGVHEQADVLFDLQRLIGGPGNDQILGQVLLDRSQLLINTSAEGVNLLAILHLDRHGNRPAAMPTAVWRLPTEVVQVTRGTLVRARNINQVAQINRTVGGGGRHSDNYVANLLLILKFPRRIDQNVLRADFE